MDVKMLWGRYRKRNTNVRASCNFIILAMLLFSLLALGLKANHKAGTQ
jgi:hypothetical protein